MKAVSVERLDQVDNLHQAIDRMLVSQSGARAKSVSKAYKAVLRAYHAG